MRKSDIIISLFCYLSLAVVAAMSLPLLCSCATPIVASKSDSVRVEIRERVVHDTAMLVIEREVDRVVTRDTTSHLANRYAVSDASVVDGLLHHSLETIPQQVAVPVVVEVHDTTIVERAAETIVREVERALTRWQRWCIALGQVLMGVVAVAILALVAYIIARRIKR